MGVGAGMVLLVLVRLLGQDVVAGRRLRADAELVERGPGEGVLPPLVLHVGNDRSGQQPDDDDHDPDEEGEVATLLASFLLAPELVGDRATLGLAFLLPCHTWPLWRCLPAHGGGCVRARLARGPRPTKRAVRRSHPPGSRTRSPSVCPDLDEEGHQHERGEDSPGSVATAERHLPGRGARTSPGGAHRLRGARAACQAGELGQGLGLRRGRCRRGTDDAQQPCGVRPVGDRAADGARRHQP